MSKEQKEKIPRDASWPEWYDGKTISETGFCEEFLESHPMKCINGRLFTVNGPVEDEEQLKRQILAEIQPYIFSGISKKVTAILDVLKLQAYAPPLPIRTDRIHLANGTLLLDGAFTEGKSEIVRSRLLIRYNPTYHSRNIGCGFYMICSMKKIFLPYRNTSATA